MAAGSDSIPDFRASLQRTLAGSYTIERELGGGGMSSVYLAEETALGRRVVIKILPPELAHAVNGERFSGTTPMSSGVPNGSADVETGRYLGAALAAAGDAGEARDALRRAVALLAAVRDDLPADDPIRRAGVTRARAEPARALVLILRALNREAEAGEVARQWDL